MNFEIKRNKDRINYAHQISNEGRNEAHKAQQKTKRKNYGKKAERVVKEKRIPG